MGATAARAAASPAARAAAAPVARAAAKPLPLDSLKSEDLPRARLIAADISALTFLRRETEYSANSFRRYMGPYPPKIGIAALGTLSDPARVNVAMLKLAGYENVLADWPERPGTVRPAAATGALAAWPEQPSERISKWFLLAFEREQGRGTPPEGRARFVPDWFESALAGLATLPAEQNRRVAWMHERMDRRIPIATFLAMARPAETDAPAGAGTTRAGAAVGRKGSAGASAGSGSPSPQLFDAQALSFARFLSQREAERFLGLMLERVLLGEPQSAAFNIAKNLLPRPDVLEKEWLAWVKESTGQRGAATGVAK